MTELYTTEDVFYEISNIRDPEKPSFTLSDLDVVSLDRCHVKYYYHEENLCTSKKLNNKSKSRSIKPTGVITVLLKPTVPHCSLMALICLSVYAKLKETLPPWMCDWKIDIKIVEGSHLQQVELEKQVGDKERVAAALENEIMMKQIEKLINADSD